MFATLVAFVALLPTPQEPGGPSPAEIAALKKLNFLVGKWEGTGWVQQGPNRQEFTGTEHVQTKLQGKALLVEGLFRENVSKKVFHETLAVITFDEKTNKYTFATYLFNRPNGNFELKLLDNGFSWQMKPNDAVTVDYTMKLEKGEWVEIGEVLMPNQQKMKFLEMRLKKVQ